MFKKLTNITSNENSRISKCRPLLLNLYDYNHYYDANIFIKLIRTLRDLIKPHNKDSIHYAPYINASNTNF